jgi:tetratricopeptide (TPR) repeat protein
MAIKGSLKEASLPDVIQLLYLGRRTGCLAVADRQNFGSIYFDAGMISYASIVNRRDRLGDILLRNRRITAEQLREAIDRQGDDRSLKVGELLVRRGAISREELETYMRLQIEEAVYYLFTWTAGTFHFDAGVEPETEDFLVAINPEYLLLEGARRVDEWSQIEKKLTSFDMIFTVDRSHAAATALPLSDAQHRVLPLLDGTRDVQQVIDEAGLPEFVVGKAIYGLITAGIAQRTGTSASLPVPRLVEQRLEEHRNLGVAFYKTAMWEDAAREFRRVGELKPGDLQATVRLGLIALHQGRFEDALVAFRAAAERRPDSAVVLHNLGYALERLGRLDEADAAFADAATAARDDGRIVLGWAIVALKRRELRAALGRLARARELLGEALPAVWYWAASLAQAQSEHPDLAASTLAEGLARHPGDPVLLTHQGVLQEAAGDVVAAEASLDAALAQDAGLPQVSKNLGDLCYRAGRYDEANAHYERAVKLAPALGDDVHFKLANIAFKQRKLAAAREGWERALSLNPAHALARRNLEMLATAT